MADNAATVRLKLARLRRNIRWMFVAHGMARVAVTFCGLLLWHYLTDTFLQLPLSLRAGMLVIMGLVLLYAVIRFIVYPLTRRLSDHELALLVEAEYPLLNDRLITALEFSADREKYAAVASPGMIDAAVAEGFDVASRLRFKEVVQSGRLLLATGIAVAAMSGLAVLFTTNQDTSRYWIARLLLNNVEYPKETFLYVRFPDNYADFPSDNRLDMNFVYREAASPPTLRAARNTNFRIVAVPSGVVPTKAMLTIKNRSRSDDVRMQVQMKPDQPEKVWFYFFEFRNLVEDDQEVWVSAGDAREGPFHIQAVAAPRIEGNVTTTVRTPVYMQRKDHRESTPPQRLAAPEGSTVTVRFAADRELRETDGARVRLYSPGVEPETKNAVRVAGASTPEYEVAFQVSSTLSEYEYLLTDREGFRNTESYRNPVFKEPDRPPEVMLQYVGHGLEDISSVPMTWGGALPLQFTVRDDYGIDKWRMMYSLPKESADGAAEMIDLRYLPFSDVMNQRTRDSAAIVAEIDRMFDAARDGTAAAGTDGKPAPTAAELAKALPAQLKHHYDVLAALRFAGLSDTLPEQREAWRNLTQAVDPKSPFMQAVDGVAKAAPGTRLSAPAAAAISATIDAARGYAGMKTEAQGREYFQLGLEYLVSIRELLSQTKYLKAQTLADALAANGGQPVPVDLHIEAEDFNYQAGAKSGGTGASPIVSYAVMTPDELESRISKYIRDTLKSSFYDVKERQSERLKVTREFLAKKRTIPYDGTEVSERTLAEFTEAQFSQSRMQLDVDRLREAFANVAQAYVYNELESTGGGLFGANVAPKENAIHSIRLALSLLACEPRVGQQLQANLARARDQGVSTKDAAESVTAVITALGLDEELPGMGSRFDKPSFAGKLRNTQFSEAAPLRNIDAWYGQITGKKVSPENAVALVSRIAAAQDQVLQGLSIAETALRLWEDFDAIREQLRELIREQDRIKERSKAPDDAKPGR
jgi:hypothetical protein